MSNSVDIMLQFMYHELDEMQQELEERITTMKLEDLHNIHPELRSKLEKLVRFLEADGRVKIQFSCGYRSHAEQDALYAQGRTKPGSIVTNAKGGHSQHNWGIAADFYLDMDVDGDGDKKDDAFNNDTQMFEYVGEKAKQFGLAWGGDWTSFKDRPHLYLPDWGSTTQRLRDTYATFEKFKQTWTREEESDKEEHPVDMFKHFVKQLQLAIGVTVDGIPGPKTLGATPTLSIKNKNQYNIPTILVQEYLNYLGHNCGKVDGYYGSNTKKGVESYQKSIGFKTPDGIMDSGKRTWKTLLGLA